MKISKQDRAWIHGMVTCEDYARDIINYIEKEQFDILNESEESKIKGHEVVE